jgi:hypothetical protein
VGERDPTDYTSHAQNTYKKLDPVIVPKIKNHTYASSLYVDKSQPTDYKSLAAASYSQKPLSSNANPEFDKFLRESHVK